MHIRAISKCSVLCPGTPSYLFEGQFPVGEPEPEPPRAQSYSSLFREQAAHVAASLAGHERTVEQLSEDLQNIMDTVNARLTGESNRLDEEFRAQEDAILASLQVHFCYIGALINF